MFTITVHVTSQEELRSLIHLAEEHGLEYVLAPQQIHLFIPDTERLMKICQALHDKP